MLQAEKTLHFFKIIALVQGVFAENWSEISPFALFLDKKTAKKRLCTRRKKTLHFFKIVALVQGVFAENWSEISPFVLFLDKKTAKKRLCTRRKKTLHFFKIVALVQGVFAENWYAISPFGVNFGHVCTQLHYNRPIFYILLKSTSHLRYNDDQNLVKVQLFEK